MTLQADIPMLKPVRNTRNLVLAFAATQLIFAGSIATAWALLPSVEQHQLLSEVTRRDPPVDVVISEPRPIRIEPLYDDPTVVSNEELAAVLTKVLPRFGNGRLKPNFAEHALRIWGDQIEFTDSTIMSGPAMREYLTDTSRYLSVWGEDSEPMLEQAPLGVAVRWGTSGTTSVHHDHMLASLTEAGVPLNAPVFTARRRMQFGDVLNQALRDFDLDERETEWSIMAFGLWLAPQKISHWHNGEGREISFDLLASRLMRNIRKHGVCLGTHRVYSLVVLLRLNETYGGELISEEVEQEIRQYLLETRDLIVAAQAEDGSFPPNWTDGDKATERLDPAEKGYRRVISTGHHLEWLAIAPPEFHPDREVVRRAARWAIRNTVETPQETINQNYTFYSHVGNALALWRKTSPSLFWQATQTPRPR